MRKLIMGIGLPGAGKTTLLRSFAEKYGHVYVSADDIRAEFGLGATDSSTKEVWTTIRDRVRDAFDKGETVVLDSTFTIGDDRRKVVELARAYGVEKIQGVYIDVPAELAWSRNESRDRTIPRDIFNERLANMRQDVPKLEDGFDSFFTLDKDMNLVQIDIREKQKEFSSNKELA